jgi:hypothetical protein
MKFGFENKKIAAKLIIFFQACLLVFVFDLYSAYAIPPVSVTNTTSSTISLQWPAIGGATGYNIYIAPEPGSLGVEPERKLVASLNNSTFTYQITNLSPNSRRRY